MLHPMPPTTCSVEGCEALARTHGWCPKHYARWLRNGDPEVLKARGPKSEHPTPCVINGCERPSQRRGWCGMHYARWYRNGDPVAVKPRGNKSIHPLELRTCQMCGEEFEFRSRGNPNRGLYCSLACSNAAKKEGRHRRGPRHPNWRGGHIESNGYRMITVDGLNGRILLAEHRHVMAERIGRDLLPTETVHHRNGDKLDNRLENLELWSSRHPRGQRVDDLVAFANEILELYG